MSTTITPALSVLCRDVDSFLDWLVELGRAEVSEDRARKVGGYLLMGDHSGVATAHKHELVAVAMVDPDDLARVAALNELRNRYAIDAANWAVCYADAVIRRLEKR